MILVPKLNVYSIIQTAEIQQRWDLFDVIIRGIIYTDPPSQRGHAAVDIGRDMHVSQ